MNLFRNNHLSTRRQLNVVCKKIIYKIKDITKIYQTDSGKIKALSDISFNVREGELVVIVGPSGCGKTTLLRLLAHLSNPTKGSVIFKGNNNSRPQNSSFGFVFQEPALMPWRTVIDNIILPLEIKGKETKEVRYQKAIRLLKLLNLKGFEKYYPSQLSGGMSQRVAIARALITDPLVLLMDEPFSALDEIMRQKLNFELLSLKKQTGKTIIFVTHNITEAVILADKIIIMGLHPNTVIGILDIIFFKRTPELLANSLFYKTITDVRKIIEKKHQWQNN